jgi:hypothetical protein
MTIKTFFKNFFQEVKDFARYLKAIFTNRAVVVFLCITFGGLLGIALLEIVRMSLFLMWGMITLPYTESPLTIFTIAFLGGLAGLLISQSVAAIKFWSDAKAETEAKEKAKINAEIKTKADAEAQREAATHKFPFALPAGTTWQQITMQFHDDENVIIRVGQWKHTANYIELGLCDGRGKTYRPSEQWRFLKVLANLEWKISIKNVESKATYKKQKQLLSEKLKAYFSLDYDPFRPYHEGNSYRTKMTLLPKPVRTSDDEDDEDVRNDAISAELHSYFAEQTTP